MKNKRTALLIVDVQSAIFNGKDPVYREKELLENLNRLENAARKANFPVIYIQHESSGLFKPGSSGWQLHKKLRPCPGDVFIGKREGNAFFETPLHGILQEKGIGRVWICGLLSQQCVLKTVLGALALGYETVLVSDAHSNSGMYPEKNISKVHKDTEKAGARLVRTEELFS